MALSRAAAERAAATSEEGGRARQRRRTRRAIVEATVRLLSGGETPTMAQVADAAEVSKRTVYLYFPTHEQLLIDATLAMLREESADAALDQSSDAQTRLAAISSVLTAMSPEIERAGRTIVRLTVDRERDPDSAGIPVRGYRRIGWLEAALEPVRAQLSQEAFDRLVQALAIVNGFESVIVLRDLFDLDLSQCPEVCRWASLALLQAALQEAVAPQEPLTT